MKKKIFIGSSGESLEIAEKVKQFLEKDFEVIVWNESIYEKSVFKFNKSFLESLLKATLKFDFGILIGTSDDVVVYRGDQVMQPRDNVLFELGLFMGRLGSSKCAFLVEKDLKILTDLKGISLSMFQKNDEASLKNAVGKIKDYFLSQDILSTNFFPSITLASTYFENLLKPICNYLLTNEKLTFKGKSYTDFTIEIIIPKKLTTDLNIQFERLKKLRTTEPLEINTAGRPRKIYVDTEIEDGELKILDFPTTLTGINHSIKNLLPESFSTMDEDYYLVIEREIKRFEQQIRLIALRHGFEDLISFSYSD